MAYNVKSRWAAFGAHLLISLFVLACLLSLIFFVWFPYDLIFAGGIEGLKIIMGVDLVLGPLLTLMVYVPGKKGLKFDLTIIGIAQIGCLMAGLWVVHNERPVVQSLADDGVYISAASVFIDPAAVAKELPGANPKFVMLDLPESADEILKVKVDSVLRRGGAIQMRKDLYIPMSDISLEQFQARLTLIKSTLSAEKLEWFDKLGKHGCTWVPVHSIHVTGYACVHPDKGVIQLSNRDY
ncbi:MAG: hypothetical protein ACI9WC_003495 [Arenicella sp.]|jgi:hypothetical protein